MTCDPAIPEEELKNRVVRLTDVGVSALLSMLNSCASGISVVNIDNGFGAGFLASRINHLP